MKNPLEITEQAELDQWRSENKSNATNPKSLFCKMYLHSWEMVAHIMGIFSRVEVHVCSRCGTDRTIRPCSDI